MIVEEPVYSPYGDLIIDTAIEQSKFMYTGKELDTESELTYFGARYYNAQVGKFTQPDSIIPDVYNPQSLNRYSYVLNNPYKYVDPDGKEAFYFGGNLGAGFGIGTQVSKGFIVSYSLLNGLQVGSYYKNSEGVVVLGGGQLHVEAGYSLLQNDITSSEGKSIDTSLSVQNIGTLATTIPKTGNVASDFSKISVQGEVGPGYALSGGTLSIMEGKTTVTPIFKVGGLANIANNKESKLKNVLSLFDISDFFNLITKVGGDKKHDK